MGWESYFSAAALDKHARFVVWQPSAITGTSARTVEESLGERGLVWDERVRRVGEHPPR